MGRHSSPQQGPYYRSVIAWFMPWVLIAAVAGTAVAIAVDALGKPDVPASAPAPVVSETPEGSPTPEPTPSPTPEPEVSPTPTPEPEETGVELITQGITVQVLNGTASDGADDLMADRLAGLGFEVVAINPAHAYERTTVFWSTDGAREAAERLAQRFGWIAQVRPNNLSATVDIHVVVGADET